MRERKIKNRGIMLLELMISTCIIILVFVGILAAYINAANLINQSREIDTATDDAKDVMEKIMTTPFANLTTVFVNNVAINPALIGGFSLLNESIIVQYPNGTLVDPLLVQVTASWTGKDRRAYTHTFYTIRTRTI